MSEREKPQYLRKIGDCSVVVGKGGDKVDNAKAVVVDYWERGQEVTRTFVLDNNNKKVIYLWVSPDGCPWVSGSVWDNMPWCFTTEPPSVRYWEWNDDTIKIARILLGHEETESGGYVPIKTVFDLGIIDYIK